MAQYFGTAEERWLDQIDSIRLMGLHATAADMQNPYGIPHAQTGRSEIKTIEQMMGEHLRQEASPA
jgi:hypothetical protein